MNDSDIRGGWVEGGAFGTTNAAASGKYNLAFKSLYGRDTVHFY